MDIFKKILLHSEVARNQFKKAVASTSGYIKFYRRSNTVASSLSPTQPYIAVVPVEAVTLDAVVGGGADVVKIDIECGEADVLNSFRNLD